VGRTATVHFTTNQKQNEHMRQEAWNNSMFIAKNNTLPRIQASLLILKRQTKKTLFYVSACFQISLSYSRFHCCEETRVLQTWFPGYDSLFMNHHNHKTMKTTSLLLCYFFKRVSVYSLISFHALTFFDHGRNVAGESARLSLHGDSKITCEKL